MKKYKTVVYTLFALYTILMLWLLFFQRVPYIDYTNYPDRLLNNINIIPFKTISEYIFTDSNSDYGIIRHAFINLAGNIVMFIPLGFFLPFVKLSCTKFKNVILSTIIIITVVEIIQLITLTGSFDIDDLLLNTVGSAIGYGIQHIIFKNKH